MWNRHVEEIRELRLMLLYYQRRDAIQRNPETFVTHEELERQLEEKAKDRLMNRAPDMNHIGRSVH